MYSVTTLVIAVGCLGLTTAPSSAQTRWEDMHGLWVQELRQCDDDGDHLRYEVRPNEIAGYEWLCRITDRQRSRLGFRVNMTCGYSGDDETEETMVIEPARSGRLNFTITTTTGTVRNTMSRCPAQPQQFAQAQSCINVAAPRQPAFAGKLIHRILPGPPNYSDVRQGDAPQPTYLLELPQPICVDAPGDEFLQRRITNRIHLLPADAGVAATLRGLINREVTLQGKDAFGEHTGHHRAPLVLTVTDISPATIPALAGEAMTTVEAFYRALETGDGGTASQMIVPEKRSGVFSAAAMSRYYGRLSEPLRLIDVTPEGVDRYVARYTFVDRNRRCNGRSMVTTIRVNEMNYIESIRSLNGC